MAKALLVGRNFSLTWALPQLLNEAGFQVDAIHSSRLLKKSRYIANFDWVADQGSLTPMVRERLKNGYQWVIITDDGTLHEILHSPLSLEEKLQVLPVLSRENFAHLFSKIGLSQVFEKAGIVTPPFFVARHFAEAVMRGKEVGYPLLVKEDISSGGSGIYECDCTKDFEKIPREVFAKSVLIQKKIHGFEIDLSAIYLKGELVHFSYAKDPQTRRKFGVAYLRTYLHPSCIDPKIVDELRQIGRALGAHGFTNISCIERSDGTRFYFEVDMRPNVWVAHSKYVGENPAERIRDWFSSQKTLTRLAEKKPGYPTQLKIPYFLRLTRRDFLLNRYQVWRYIPTGEPGLVARLICKKILSWHSH